MGSLPFKNRALRHFIAFSSAIFSIAASAQDRGLPEHRAQNSGRVENDVRCDPASFRFVIDVGHTKAAPGATSARGVPEYVFNLSLAKQVEQTLKSGGFQKAHLSVTEGTGRAQLAARSARANALKPGLFVSIHHDDVQSRYYEKWRFEGKIRSYSDKFAGYSIFVSYLNSNLDSSLRFAKLLGAELKDRGMHHSTHHAEDVAGERRQLIDPNLGVYRYDRLYVLRNTHAPAVLLEAGILTNRQEELKLGSAENRALIGTAMLAAASKFCRQ